VNLGVMEGQGSYNRHALSQASGGTTAVPLLEQAAALVEPPPDGPLLVADYGASQGRNSLAPMRAAIRVLRERFGPDRPICIAHTDLPGNDFGALFQTVRTDPGSYLHGQTNIYPSAVGRSFFEPVLPPGRVTLGWSSFAAQWLSRVPRAIPGHLHELCATSAERGRFKQQAAADWRTFLALRACELCPSGRLVIVLPARSEADTHGFEPLFDIAYASVVELVERGVISHAESQCMVISDCVRDREELLAPFAETASFAGLVVEHCEVMTGPDPMWAAYLRHGDTRRLATARARFYRATFAPTLAAALNPTAAAQTFADALEAAIARRVAARPCELPQTLAAMVVMRRE
jgi:hypothetical protein